MLGISPDVLSAFLLNCIKRLNDVRRWKPKECKFPENVLDHSFSMVLLTEIMISIEHALGKTDFDAHKLITMAAIHDLGEGTLGDMNYVHKSDRRIRKGLKEIEREQFNELLAGLPEEVKKEFLECYDEMSKKSFEARFFKGAEILGYIIYALREYKAGNTHFIEVLKRIYGWIKPQQLKKQESQSKEENLGKFLKEVKSFWIIYYPFEQEIEHALQIQRMH